MKTDSLMEVMRLAALRVRLALDGLDDWGPAGAERTHSGQYRSDVVADAAVLEVLFNAGIAVLSEESGSSGEGELVAVVDPVDGSTNASLGLPWYATSICIVDGEGPLAALVVNQATGRSYEAVRGKGSTRDGETIRPRPVTKLSEATIGVSGYPPAHLGWRQYRALGAAALDLCAVADGTLDAYADFGPRGHGVWDYLGGLLVCREAGAVACEVENRELFLLDTGTRRMPMVGATPELLEELVVARRAAASR